MKISYKTDYSLKVILDLSKNYPDQLVHIDELSRRQDIPKKYLEQLLLSLKQGGFVRSKKGPKGGYSLASDPAKISLGDVIRFMEGPIYPISCIDPAMKQECDFKHKCVFTAIWKNIEATVSGIVDKISFADLAEAETRLLGKNPVDYQI